jgi:hypothetical protein
MLSQRVTAKAVWLQPRESEVKLIEFLVMLYLILVVTAVVINGKRK